MQATVVPGVVIVLSLLAVTACAEDSPSEPSP
jgi:hypothetical protein